tara:strand:- start:2666 stop:2914 length:249 start_codon:yes stop_codon:yes gene_type:complete
MKSKNQLKLKTLLTALTMIAFLSGCVGSRVVFIDSQSQIFRVGPNVKGKVYHWNGEEWQLSGNKVEYPEGHFVGGLTPEDDD